MENPMPPLPLTIQIAPLAMLIIAACASGPGALSAPDVSIVQLSS
ncbi:MAG TPA: hypothetical protein VNA04_01450 [Thermoanaerobaculia bacterium]|nr:hypothetical protein [Thermoanaerobaculia bacterium]